ncbi:MAG: phospho-N-acetylmuramoyl-pentapeptide-transferase [Candidatus Fervidibacter sp.]|uniref:phospho-N-acetylmuramoyl-pentapeptide- transferase n=1 Tax=Candidatus Fervidibacter sp. TaxID=3100871 RepID=UPI004049FC81
MKSLPVILVGTSAALTALMTWWLLPLLREIKGETIREDVPERHRAKAGTPTMGGVTFAVAVPLTTMLASFLAFPRLLIDSLIFSGAMVSYALLGLADDWAKLTKNKGWRTQPKLAMQIVLAIFWIWLLKLRLGLQPPLPYPVLNWLWTVFLLILFLATVNGVNISDGLDGLASGLTAIAAFAIGFLAWRNGFVTGALTAFAICGGCLGFLVFNRYPAKVFMGDVGSMALGAGLTMSVITSRSVLPFLLIGMVFWVEQLTVMLQVAYFRWTKKRYGEGRRIFPMTPIHHSFELLGWHEPIIVIAFWLAGAVFAALGVGASLILSGW